MKNYFLSIVVIVMGFLVACGGSNPDKTKNDQETTTNESATTEYDLTANEIPVIVNAPAGAEIKKGIGNGEIDGIRTIDYEVVKGAFKLDVNYTVSDYDKAELLTDAKQFAKEEEGFAEFVSEEEMGFIYKLNTEDGEDYSFYYLLMKNNKPIEFGTGLSFVPFTLDQVKVMYEAAKAAK